MVTSGAIRLFPDGPLLGPGDAAVVPAGTPIQLANPGPDPAVAHVVIRAGFSATQADGSAIPTHPGPADAPPGERVGG
jgi:hypothetical protein